MRLWLFAILIVSSAIGFSQTGPNDDFDLHEATLLIYDRIQSVQPCTNRGDTLFFADVKCGAGRPCGALLLDELYPLRHDPNAVLGVFRVFDVSNEPFASSDTSRWEAITYLGTGRGYQVQFGLSYFNATPAGLTLNGIDLDVGYLGEGFDLPEWSIHEFNDGDSPWGAMVFVNHSWRMGFGHSTLSVLDLGGTNHHQFTLHHVVDAQRTEVYRDDQELPSEWRGVKEKWNERYGVNTDPERHYLCELDWYFEGRTLVIEEHPNYTYYDKINGEYPPVDSVVIMPTRWHTYREDVWPSRYTSSSW